MNDIINISVDINPSSIAGADWLKAITRELDGAMHNLGYFRTTSSKSESILFTYRRFAICGKDES